MRRRVTRGSSARPRGRISTRRPCWKKARRRGRGFQKAEGETNKFQVEANFVQELMYELKLKDKVKVIIVLTSIYKAKGLNHEHGKKDQVEEKVSQERNPGMKEPHRPRVAGRGPKKRP